jgi:hypothetical protein
VFALSKPYEQWICAIAESCPARSGAHKQAEYLCICTNHFLCFRFVNDAKGVKGKRNNIRFFQHTDPRELAMDYSKGLQLFIQACATDDIKAGEELFFDYGKMFWDDVKHMAINKVQVNVEQLVELGSPKNWKNNDESDDAEEPEEIQVKDARAKKSKAAFKISEDSEEIQLDEPTKMYEDENSDETLTLVLATPNKKEKQKQAKRQQKKEKESTHADETTKNSKRKYNNDSTLTQPPPKASPVFVPKKNKKQTASPSPTRLSRSRTPSPSPTPVRKSTKRTKKTPSPSPSAKKLPGSQKDVTRDDLPNMKPPSKSDYDQFAETKYFFGLFVCLLIVVVLSFFFFFFLFGFV